MIIYIAIRHGIPLVFCPCQKRLRSPIFRLQSINRFPTQIFEWKKNFELPQMSVILYPIFSLAFNKKRVAVKRHYVILSVSYCNGNQVKKYHQKRENFPSIDFLHKIVAQLLSHCANTVYYYLSPFFSYQSFYSVISKLR